MNLIYLDLAPAYIPFVVQCTKGTGEKVDPTVDNLIIYEEGGADAVFDSTTITGSPFDPAKINTKTGLWGSLVAKSALMANKWYIVLWEMTVDGITTAKVERYFVCNHGTAQTGDAYGIVNNGTYGNSALNSSMTTLLSRASEIRLAELDAANLPADLNTLIARLTMLRAGYLDNLSGGTVALDATVAKESTLLALGVSVAALPTVVQISAAVTALGGIGGIITGVVDAGVTVSSSFNPITMEKGEKKVIAYQIKENDVAIDVSAYTFTFGVKRDLYDTVYAFAAVAGVISADDDGVLSIVTFTIPAASTKALAVIESGRYSVGMYDGVGNKVALTPPGGVSFRLTEDILDVA